MARRSGSTRGDVRSSALWGTGGREGRSGLSAVVGKRSRASVAVLALVLTFALPASGMAGSSASNAYSSKGRDKTAVPNSLLAQAAANPDATFKVIVQAERGRSSDDAANRVKGLGKLKKKFRSLNGVAAEVTGKQLLKLAKHTDLLAITLDAPVKSTGYQDAEMWRESTQVNYLWNELDLNTGEAIGPAPQAPAIAIVDSGVDATKVGDFGLRVRASVNLSSLSPLATGDDQGHGTMVAGIAAGASPLHPGVAQNAPIVSIRTSDANGMSVMSDVIAAADWILANKDAYNIRVANFSLRGSVETSFRYDPLDKAVERLWFSGVTVVTAAGNHGSASGPVSMSYAPGNDPFVITVGALDEQQSSDPLDNQLAWWSGHGTTMDGFAKPEVAAPGRFMIMPVPASSTIYAQFPERHVSPGYMWMSGTSFAAPIVSGIAAQMLARHPEWGPDQVKGALMRTTNYLSGPGMSAGVGEVDGLWAAYDEAPPNPNENFYAFVTTDPVTGAKTFDEAAWASHVESNAAWSSAAWSSAAWSNAAWSSAAWQSAAWQTAAWSSDVSSQMQSAATGNENSHAE
jgi:serine protease AprX